MGLLSLTPRRDGGRTARTRFVRDFGLDLAASPFGREVQAAFETLTEHSDLSRDARTALLYRLFVRRALARKEYVAAPNPSALLAALEALMERSGDYSEAAPDHLAFEAATAPMNAWIARRLAEVTSHGRA